MAMSLRDSPPWKRVSPCPRSPAVRLPMLLAVLLLHVLAHSTCSVGATSVQPIAVLEPNLRFPNGASSLFFFGRSIQQFNDSIVIGSPSTATVGPSVTVFGSGRVTFMRYNSSQWNVDPSDWNVVPLIGAQFAQIGLYVSMYGNIAASAGSGATFNNVTLNSLTALVWEYNGTAWQQSELYRFNGTSPQRMANMVAVSTHTLWAAVRAESVVVRYQRIGIGSYTATTVAGAPLGQPFDFGSTVQTNHQHVFVGASKCIQNTANTAPPVVLVLDMNGALVQTISPPPTAVSVLSCFGETIAVSNWTLLIGAPYTLSEIDFGRAYIYTYSPLTGQWTFQKELLPSPQGVQFAGAVTLDGDIAVASTTQYRTAPALDDVGAAWIFLRNQGGAESWDQVTFMTPYGSAEQLEEQFGSSVSLVGRRLAVGAPGDTTAGNPSGAVFMYELGCEAGSFLIAANNTCAPCPSPLTSLYGATTCVCPSGQFFSLSQGVCVPCPNGTALVLTNNVLATACNACPDGTYTNATGSSACLACPLGFSCTGGFIVGPGPGGRNGTGNSTNPGGTQVIVEVPFYVWIIIGLLALGLLVLTAAVCALRRWNALSVELQQPLLALQTPTEPPTNSTALHRIRATETPPESVAVAATGAGLRAADAPVEARGWVRPSPPLPLAAPAPTGDNPTASPPGAGSAGAATAAPPRVDLAPLHPLPPPPPPALPPAVEATFGAAALPSLRGDRATTISSVLDVREVTRAGIRALPPLRARVRGLPASGGTTEDTGAGVGAAGVAVGPAPAPAALPDHREP